MVMAKQFRSDSIRFDIELYRTINIRVIALYLVANAGYSLLNTMKTTFLQQSSPTIIAVRSGTSLISFRGVANRMPQNLYAAKNMAKASVRQLHQRCLSSFF